MQEETPFKSFVKTTKQVIQELESIKQLEVSNFKDAVEEAFDRYNVDGIEDLVGFEAWPALEDGDYQLLLKVDHEDAYEFTIHTTVQNNKATVTNVL